MASVTLRRTHAPLYVTRVLRTPAYAAVGVRMYRGGYVSRGQAPWLLYAAPQYAGLSSCRGMSRGGISQPRACGVPQQ